jgi:KUP system potassium uptake protein
LFTRRLANFRRALLESLIPTIGAAMALWREKLFVAMHRDAGSMANYLNLPPNRVVELGSQVAL